MAPSVAEQQRGRRPGGHTRSHLEPEVGSRPSARTGSGGRIRGRFVAVARRPDRNSRPARPLRWRAGGLEGRSPDERRLPHRLAIRACRRRELDLVAARLPLSHHSAAGRGAVRSASACGRRPSRGSRGLRPVLAGLWMFTFQVGERLGGAACPGGTRHHDGGCSGIEVATGEQWNYGSLTREAGRRPKRSRRCSATRGRTPHSSSREDHQPDHVPHDPRLAPAPKCQQERLGVSVCGRLRRRAAASGVCG